MTDAFLHHPWTVQSLVEGVASSQVRLPDIQRPFVWSNTKVRDLVDSMYRGYPVGELMFWANRSGEHTRAIGVGTQDVSMQVVDGQQRLTSLYAVVKGLDVWREDYSRGPIKISFSPIHQRFDVPTPATLRSAEWIPDITAVFEDPIEARHAFLDRYRASIEGTDTVVDERAIETAINQLDSIKKYVFQVVQLHEHVSRETVADVFVRINSEGVSLSPSDFILTWMSVFWEEGRQQLETFARDSRFTPVGISQITGEKITWTPHNPHLIVDPGQMLRVAIAVGLRRGRLSIAYNRLRGRNPKTREIDTSEREAELARLKIGQERALKPLHWDEFLKVIERAGLVSKDLVSSKTALLYAYALWLIGREDFKVPVDSLREVMARWLFMVQITSRYSGSSETQIEEDMARVDGVPGRSAEDFVSTLNELINAAVPSDFWTVTLPEQLISSSTRAPAYLGYLAALNILDADVLLSPMPVKSWMDPRRRTVKGVEKHHLFPKDYLKSKLGITSTKRINQVANYALVEWSTNIDISADEPATYWPKQLADKKMEGERFARQVGWHALPDDWTSLDYDTFLRERRSLMARVTSEGFKRLTDPNYVPVFRSDTDSSEEAVTDVLPTLAELVAEGIIPPGTLITSSDEERETIGEITDDGTLLIGNHSYDSLTLAAHESGAEVDDGWDFWLAHLDASEPTVLAELRKRMIPAA